MASETRGTVLAALGANLAVGVAKAVGGLVTGSAALMSEAAHSVADTLNEVFLLLSIGRAARPADRTHPFGYGKERFFWSLIAAVGIFVSGAGFSAYQGIEALTAGHEEPSTRSFLVIYAVLAVSLLLEGLSLAKALRQVRSEASEARRAPWVYVRRSPDPTVKTVASEDTAAVVGVLFALVGTMLHQITGDEVWDGVASLLIAALLAYVAFVLGRDTKELLIGEAADPSVRLGAYDLLRRRPEVTRVGELLTMQLGPSSVLVVGRVSVDESLGAIDVARMCNEVEDQIRDRHPDVVQFFLDAGGASAEEDRSLDDRFDLTVDEVRELDGQGALPVGYRTRTARRASVREPAPVRR
ncbi:MAG: cation diffusion facilitator family transporter [Frankiales bacterium]|nr:cation diffusion facilitator family transporter [Frankiales bacterium]